jgi:hypothetical protein
MGDSTKRRASDTIVKPNAVIVDPVMLPSPPRTMIISKLKVMEKLKKLGDTVVIRDAISPPATPAKNPLTTNAKSLCLKMGMPIASAATSSSRIDFIARP